MTRKRTRSKASAPVTGVAAGNLGTAANLDDTQVLRTTDLGTTDRETGVPDWLDEYAPPVALGDRDPVELEPVAPAPVDPVPVHAVAPLRSMPARRATLPGLSLRGRRRGLALMGAGALGALVLLAGAGILSQLDLGSGATGGQPNVQAFGFTTESPFAETPQPSAESGKGHGHDGCHGRHCN